MKKFLIVLAFMLVGSVASAANYRFQVENLVDAIYETTSGVVIVSDKDCEVEDYKEVELHLYGNPADSTVGPLFDNFTYKINEAFIDMEDPTNLFIDEREVTKECNVYSVAYLRDSGPEAIVSNSRSVYDASNETLYLFDTGVWEDLVDTGIVYSFAKLKYMGGNDFILEELVE